MSLVDRAEAGRSLATQVAALRWQEPFLVVATSPSAVPVAFEVARRLHAELDLREIRPFFTPRKPIRELGVVASGGMRLVHEHVQAAAKLTDEQVAAAAAPVEEEIRRQEHHWRRRHPRTECNGCAVALVTDVLGPHSDLESAVLLMRTSGAARVLVVAAAGATRALDPLRGLADGVLCLWEQGDPTSLRQAFATQPPPDADGIEALLERAEEWRALVPSG